MPTFEPQPWLGGALERLEARRGERVLVLFVAERTCLSALRRAVGGQGELLLVEPDRETALAAGQIPGLEVLAYEPEGRESFGTFDAMLAGPALAPRLGVAGLAGLARANLRPGGRFVLDLPGEVLCEELAECWQRAGGEVARLAGWHGPTEAELGDALRAAGLRDVEVARLTASVRFESPGALARLGARVLGADAQLAEGLQRELITRFRSTGPIDVVFRRVAAVGRH